MPTKTNISGFPEYLPAEQLAFNTIVSKITAVYQSFGFVPLETAAVERIDTLTSKGIDSKEVYALRRLNAEGDSGDKDIALRFDLTVPLARYVADNYGSLTFPFRRYQCQPVWRGERAQKGRYRQFHQFDIDTINDGPLPITADAEIIAAAHTTLKAILPQGAKFVMMINNRKLLCGILEHFGFKSKNDQYNAIKIIDGIDKIGEDITIRQLSEINDSSKARELVEFINRPQTEKSVNALNLSYEGKEGSSEIFQVANKIKELLGPDIEQEPSLAISLTIARGLDYYTGTVVETFLEAAPELGSICSGGRYDNLTESLSSRRLPGVGISIGISRLASWLMEQPEYQNLPASTARVIVTGINAPAICSQLRQGGIAAELALGDKTPGQHFQTAQKRGIAYGIIAETPGTVDLRIFSNREQHELATPELIPTLQKYLK